MEEFGNGQREGYGKYLQKTLAMRINKEQPPAGFNDAELWRALDDDVKEKFLSAEDKTRTDSIFSSQVAKFFFDWSSEDFDFDSAVNALSLVNGKSANVI